MSPSLPTASTIGPIIPPSIPMVISGATAEVSVGTLFLGGFIPGVLMGSHLAHFGLILVLNLMIGVATPPAGLSLFVVSEAQDIRLERPMRECIAADLPLPPAA